MTDQSDRHDQLLLLLAANLQQSALVQLGKLADPVTGQTDVDLAAAHLTIDLLDMLRTKCRHGTAEPIVRDLDRIVMDLQLNYTDVAARQTGSAAESAAAEELQSPQKEDRPGEAAATDGADGKQA